ncbi:hypothetical protein PIB30_096333 [Stylosanthes scabra]|uniref:Uncharacterized protein n=1 Tax=Stylosanthes scabra TaxID=79078 RepID=A0ABU6VUN3_9FABA|nr:hypothetical protein [Stylosanthes scabra]
MKRLQIDDVKATRMSLQLADWSIKYPIATGRALIDVQNGELTLRVHDEKMVINVFKAMQYPREEDVADCMRIDIIEELIKEVQQDEVMQKFKAAHERYKVLKNTNQEFVLQEIQDIMQENKAEIVQQPSAQIMQPMVEEIQPRIDIVQQHDDKFMQQKIEEERQQDNLLQQNIQEEMQQKEELQQKHEESKENQKLTLKPLPSTLKYTFLDKE